MNPMRVSCNRREWLPDFAACCLCVTAFFLAMAGKASGAGVYLAWNPSPDTNVAGYAIYYGGSSRDYTNRLDVGNKTSTTVTGLVVGVTYYFAATAYDRTGNESDFSNEAAYVVSPVSTNQAAAPLLSGFTKNSQGASLTWSCLSGRSYAVVCKTNLSDPNWTSLSPALLATSNSLYWIDTNTVASRQKFYTIVLLP